MGAHSQAGEAQPAAQDWDAAAPNFDAEPDHGLRDPVVRAAWADFLSRCLPPAPAVVLDVGCGTGSMSLLLAERGYAVTGIDYSPGMLALAEAKARAAGQAITFRLMDAARPDLAPQQFDALVCRHVVWALPEHRRVLARWAELVRPGGRLCLVEGFWHTGSGLHAPELLAALPPSLTEVVVHDLGDRAALWGGAVADERYAVTARRPR